MADMEQVLLNEYTSLEPIHGQNIDTGAGLHESQSFLENYTNRLFGAPFQLMNSVDKRIGKINPNLGNQYLKNIMLNSPILHIKPGLPKYMGKEEDFADLIRTIVSDASDGGSADSTVTQLMKDTFFSAGKKLQRRMFGFKSEFKKYMSHVNYMCRSMACFLTLTSGKDFPAGAVSNASTTELEEFKQFKWENYRMLNNVNPQNALEELKDMSDSTLLGSTASAIGTILGGGIDTAVKNTALAIAGALGLGGGDGDLESIMGENTANFLDSAEQAISNIGDAVTRKTIKGVLDKQVTAVMFMVEPGSFSENLTNEVADSQIEATLDGINQGLGQEIAFMTGSNVDTGLIDDMASFLGNAATGVTDFVAGLVEPATGGFVHNMFNGALNSLKGQKMIYPKIYKSSNSKMDYNFTVNLSTPYGDVYNYYLHIIVPLMHLIALTAPRMVSANSLTSPFLVQAFIPGTCTCQLGMITNMDIIKNPNGNRISVHGFPLDVQVKFTITELYNAMSISPASDPASFMFNETLNDYMANLSGLVPSMDTYTKQREQSFNALQTYMGIKTDEKGNFIEQDLENSEMANDLADGMADRIRDLIQVSTYSG